MQYCFAKPLTKQDRILPNPWWLHAGQAVYPGIKRHLPRQPATKKVESKG
jgi:hypothetical protein